MQKDASPVTGTLSLGAPERSKINEMLCGAQPAPTDGTVVRRRSSLPNDGAQQTVRNGRR